MRRAVPARPAAVPLRTRQYLRKKGLKGEGDLHVVLVADAEADQDEAVHHDNSDTKRYKECKDDGLGRVIHRSCGHGTDTGGLDGNGANDLPPLMPKFRESNNVDTAGWVKM
jgi:hypothetical protein